MAVKSDTDSIKVLKQIASLREMAEFNEAWDGMVTAMTGSTREFDKAFERARQATYAIHRAYVAQYMSK